MSARTKKASFVILRQEYLEITGGDFCAAKLIEYQGEVAVLDSPEEKELLLSGLVIK